MKASRPILIQNVEDESSVEKLYRILTNIGLLALSALLFALSFPNLLFKWGLFPLAFIAIAPMFVVVHRSKWVGIPFYGLFAGFISYVFLNYWLIAFHPLTIFIVPGIYAIYFLVLFPVLKLADTLFPSYGYLAQVFVWMAYEYLRTLGFLGYSYGILGYSQSLFLPLARLSSLTGVWGVSMLVIIPSAFLGNAARDSVKSMGSFIRLHRIDVIVYAIAFLGAVGYGIVSKVDYSTSKTWRMGLVQQDVDPWRGGLPTYTESLNRSINESNLALQKNPDIVVWSETSFVPAIDYHMRYRDEPETDALVKRLLAYMAAQNVPFVIGNDDGELQRNGDGTLTRVDYNAVVLFQHGVLTKTYRKTRLVPFTESFPYKKQLPFVYNALVKADTHFWKKGDEFTVFDAAGVKFSTPICFEDTFGYISRNFVRNGAQVIVNLTNDSWSYSVPAEMQHMQMAVFRATENARSVVRSTNGGMTTVIDPNGRILKMLPAFVLDNLVANVPVYDSRTTLYTQWGDWFAILLLVLAGATLIAGSVRRIVRSFRVH